MELPISKWFFGEEENIQGCRREAQTNFTKLVENMLKAVVYLATHTRAEGEGKNIFIKSAESRT